MTRLSTFALIAAIASLAQVSPGIAAGSNSGGNGAAAAAGANAQQPQTTSETYGDWTLRCTTASQANSGNGQAAQQTHCEIAEPINVKGQNRPVAVIAVGPDAAKGPMRLVAQVPVGAWIPTAPKLVVGSNSPVELSFKRCLPRACLASVDLTNDLRDKMKAETSGGQIIFRMNPGQDVKLPVTFKGFTAAINALEKKTQ